MPKILDICLRLTRDQTLMQIICRDKKAIKPASQRYNKLYRHKNKYAKVPILTELSFVSHLGKSKVSDKYVN